MKSSANTFGGPTSVGEHSRSQRDCDSTTESPWHCDSTTGSPWHSDSTTGSPWHSDSTTGPPWHNNPSLMGLLLCQTFTHTLNYSKKLSHLKQISPQKQFQKDNQQGSLEKMLHFNVTFSKVVQNLLPTQDKVRIGSRNWQKVQQIGPHGDLGK